MANASRRLPRCPNFCVALRWLNQGIKYMLATYVMGKHAKKRRTGINPLMKGISGSRLSGLKAIEKAR